jgi:hypothetical protein
MCQLDWGRCTPPSCTNACSPNDMPACDGLLYSCKLVDGCYEWIGTPCEYGCQNGNCLPAPPACTNECNIGSKFICDETNTNILFCDLKSNGCYGWEVEPCDYGCSGGRCISYPGTY